MTSVPPVDLQIGFANLLPSVPSLKKPGLLGPAGGSTRAPCAVRLAADGESSAKCSRLATDHVPWGVDVGCSERHDCAASPRWLIGAQPASFPEAWIVRVRLEVVEIVSESSTGPTWPRTGRRIPCERAVRL